MVLMTYDLIPGILKAILYLVFKLVKEIFTIEEDDYSPIFTMLIFNFYISPKIQEIYKLNIKYPQIKNINRLLRNICFNKLFDEKDEMFIYNELIEQSYIKIKSMVKQVKFPKFIL